MHLKEGVKPSFFLCSAQDAVRDGLRAVKNALEDGYVVPGCGAFEVAVHLAIRCVRSGATQIQAGYPSRPHFRKLHSPNFRKGLNELKGKERLGMQAYADGMLVIPKTLAQNAGEGEDGQLASLRQRRQSSCWPLVY